MRWVKAIMQKFFGRSNTVDELRRVIRDENAQANARALANREIDEIEARTFAVTQRLSQIRRTVRQWK